MVGIFLLCICVIVIAIACIVSKIHDAIKSVKERDQLTWKLHAVEKELTKLKYTIPQKYPVVEELQQQIDYLNNQLFLKEEQIQQQEDLLQKLPTLQQFHETENKSKHLMEENAILRQMLDRANEALRNQKSTNHDISQKLAKQEQESLSLAQYRQMRDFKNQAREITKEINKTFQTQYNVPSFFESITQNRLNRAFEKPIFIDRFDCSVSLRSAGTPYTVSLRECTCPDFIQRQKSTRAGEPVDPCKHMLFLAYTFGLLQNSYRECTLRTNQSIAKLNKLSLLVAAQEEKNRIGTALEKELGIKIKQHEKVLAEYKEELQAYLQEQCPYHPKLAGVMADLETLYYERSAQYLEKKRPPAPAEAMRIRELRVKTNQYLAQKKEAEYKLAYLQQLFPNIDVVFADDFVPNKWFKIQYCSAFDKDNPADTF